MSFNEKIWAEVRRHVGRLNAVRAWVRDAHWNAGRGWTHEKLDELTGQIDEWTDECVEIAAGETGYVPGKVLGGADPAMGAWAEPAGAAGLAQVALEMVQSFRNAIDETDSYALKGAAEGAIADFAKLAYLLRMGREER